MRGAPCAHRHEEWEAQQSAKPVADAIAAADTDAEAGAAFAQPANGQPAFYLFLKGTL